MISLGTADDGRSIPVAVGETVELVLDEPVGGGYQWSWELTDGLAEVDGGGVPSTAAPGASGLRTLRLRVRRGGRHRLRGRLARSWEPAPLRELSIELVGE